MVRFLSQAIQFSAIPVSKACYRDQPDISVRQMVNNSIVLIRFHLSDDQAAGEFLFRHLTGAGADIRYHRMNQYLLAADPGFCPVR